MPLPCRVGLACISQTAQMTARDRPALGGGQCSILSAFCWIPRLGGRWGPRWANTHAGPMGKPTQREAGARPSATEAERRLPEPSETTALTGDWDSRSPETSSLNHRAALPANSGCTASDCVLLATPVYKNTYPHQHQTCLLLHAKC